MLMMTSRPLGWNTPLRFMLNLSNLWMARGARASHSTPSLSASSSVGPNVARFFW